MIKNNTTILISYDVENKHLEVKKNLEMNGYMDYWEDNNGEEYKLPNTTLIKIASTPFISKLDLVLLCRELDIKLLSFVAVRITEMDIFKS